MVRAEGSIQVEGLRELRKALRDAEDATPKALRLAGNDAAELVVDASKSRMPSKSGRAKRSVRATSSQTSASVSGGGRRVPYYGWLDFGGSVGKGRSIKRPFIRSGRYLFAAYDSNKGKIADKLEGRIREVVKDAGLDVT